MTSMDHLAFRHGDHENAAKRSGNKDPLPRLLAQLINRAGGNATVERATSRPWASALFQGRRHLIALKICGPDAMARRVQFATGLEEAEWTLPRHFVADITIDACKSSPDEERIELSALTIEDW